jgi:hypothetical protein
MTHETFCPSAQPSMPGAVVFGVVGGVWRRCSRPVVQMHSSCRWYAEQGGSVCLRCPQVMTTDYPRPGNDLVRLAATPIMTEPL